MNDEQRDVARTFAAGALSSASRAAESLEAFAGYVEADEVGMEVEDLAAVARVLAGRIEALIEALPTE